MLYSYLNQPIVEAIIQHKNNADSSRQPMAPIFANHKIKAFYWTIGKLESTNKLVTQIQDVQLMLLQQCK